MQWTAEAETALKKVPFFVRKKVKSSYKKKSRGGKRFAEILTAADFNDLVELFSNQV
jgi:hypothetical protein